MKAVDLVVKLLGESSVEVIKYKCPDEVFCIKEIDCDGPKDKDCVACWEREIDENTELNIKYK